MKLQRRAVSALCVLAMTLALSSAKIAAAADYKAGQVWQYKTRPGEETSQVYIVKVENVPVLGDVFHIYIDGLKLMLPSPRGAVQSALPHAPVDAKSLAASLTVLVREGGPMPDISNGYSVWRAAFDAGQAGVFNIPLSDIIGIVEKSINNRR